MLLEDIMKRFALVLTLVLALGAGFGCAKKATGSDPGMSDGGWTAEERAAIQQITDGRVHFAFDKFDINNQGKEILKQKAELMKRYPRIRVRIEGNCDARGTQEYNLALGERRARAAYEYLSVLGVNAGQMEMLSFGKENPLVEGTGDKVWAENRRDDFRVVNN